jgi:hypothetical protein
MLHVLLSLLSLGLKVQDDNRESGVNSTKEEGEKKEKCCHLNLGLMTKVGTQ